MRAAICKAMADLIKSGVDGSEYSNLFTNVSTKNLHFDEIPDFPYCTVTPGMSTRKYMPGSFTWVYQDIRIRLYVKDDDAEGKLELLIADIEKIIDSNLSIEYTITKASGDVETGYTTESRINSVTTDEGILKPLGFGEISVNIQYAK